MEMNKARRKWLLSLVADRIHLLRGYMTWLEDPPVSVQDFIDKIYMDSHLPLPQQAIMNSARSVGFIGGVSMALGIVVDDLVVEAMKVCDT